MDEPQQTGDAAVCPSCGRFTGPYETCPYCGARRKGRLSLRAVKLAALVVALTGLAALWLAARATEVPLITVETAQGTMNMAYVRVKGQVVRGPTYDPESAYLSFWLDDRTGEIHISSYRDVTEALLAERQVPDLGDEVEVAGTLRIREDYAALTLNAPEHLSRNRPDPLPVKAGALTELDEGLRVRVRGEIRDVRTPYTGLTILTVRDDSGDIAVTAGDAMTALWGPLPDIAPGQLAVITGTVTLYKGTPQVSLPSPDNIQLLGDSANAVQAPTPLGSLTAADAGRWIFVQGRLITREPFSSGFKGTLDDGTGQITLLIWQNVWNSLDEPAILQEGASIAVQGEVKLYHEVLEIVPEAALDVRAAPAALAIPEPGAPGGAGTATPPAPETPVTALSACSQADEGGWFRVQGRIVAVSGFNGGLKATLDDGTGQVTLLVWQRIHNTLDDPTALEVGATLDVEGQLQVYAGELELIPLGATNIRWLAPAPELAWVSIGDLSPRDVGRAVRLRGVLGIPTAFSAGVKAELDDGTGVITVLLWSNIAEDLEVAPAGGMLVEVFGEIAIYNDALEIIPRSHYDWRPGP
ncbi:MAG: hypothetical protein JXB35_12080 [Anaerolineae bacterium]|nr:hypothetical protein [Anaerolineae bacterium]